jgi:hypothetical protein
MVVCRGRGGGDCDYRRSSVASCSSGNRGSRTTSGLVTEHAHTLGGLGLDAAGVNNETSHSCVRGSSWRAVGSDACGSSEAHCAAAGDPSLSVPARQRRASYFESGSIVRMEVPVASLPAYGIDISPAAGGGPIEADVLVGQDGQPRAIRLVTNSSRSTQ